MNASPARPVSDVTELLSTMAPDVGTVNPKLRRIVESAGKERTT
jgi:hypothetical protein